MPKASRMHHADEFGNPQSGGVVGVGAPNIGAAGMITMQGISERDTGATPPPPPVSMKALLVGLVVLFLLGLVTLAVLVGPALLRGWSFVLP